jgi:hypothetical protein
MNGGASGYTLPGPAVRGPSTLLGLGPCTPYRTYQKVIYAAYHLLHDSHERVTFFNELL